MLLCIYFLRFSFIFIISYLWNAMFANLCKFQQEVFFYLWNASSDTSPSPQHRSTSLEPSLTNAVTVAKSYPALLFHLFFNTTPLHFSSFFTCSTVPSGGFLTSQVLRVNQSSRGGRQHEEAPIPSPASSLPATLFPIKVSLLTVSPVNLPQPRLSWRHSSPFPVPSRYVAVFFFNTQRKQLKGKERRI